MLEMVGDNREYYINGLIFSNDPFKIVRGPKLVTALWLRNGYTSVSEWPLRKFRTKKTREIRCARDRHHGFIFVFIVELPKSPELTGNAIINVYQE